MSLFQIYRAIDKVGDALKSIAITYEKQVNFDIVQREAEQRQASKEAQR